MPQQNKMNHTNSHCGAAWKTFQEDFRNTTFGHIMITLYTLGVVFNLLNIVIFMKKNKVSSSNVLFTSLAISDLTVSILGIPFWWYFLKPGAVSSSKSQLTTGHYYVILLRLFFNISVLHTTMLAIWRFIAVTYPLKERKWCSLRNTFIAIVFLYAFCILYEMKTCYTHVPEIILLKKNTSYFTTDATNQTIHTTSNMIKERTSSTKLGIKGFSCTFLEYIYVVFTRILPSIVIIVCSCRLIYVLQHSKKRRKELKPNLQNHLAKDIEKDKQMNRTTRMLLGIMILFLVDNVAGAVTKILIILYDINFINDCLPAIVQVTRILSLIYVSTPFVVYYVSSQHFRDGFKSLFPSKKCTLSSDEEVSVQINTESTYL